MQPKGASIVTKQAHEGCRARVSSTPGSCRTCCTPRTMATVINTTFTSNDTRGHPAGGLIARCAECTSACAETL
eukprot:2952540-Pleurochrysis_carterae.AAC.1